MTALLNGFEADWTLHRPNTAGRFTGRDQRTEVSPIGAISWLAEETRRNDPTGRGVPRKTILGIKAGRFPTTELGVADAIVTALDKPEVFRDGTLTIRPNPHAEPGARAACCGGTDVLFQIEMTFGANGAGRFTT